ncbi:hypothetical protein KUTeg_014822 [Tegillarca granosa]|uniref:Uncharacterized protein n=1 Tax=Tegillarca granosa TaxID=220873 RepID=A0ABQ9EUK3_TEGGR|nr:hypothetical protein KUTeg_014822 [Tegillarca granosa]
MPLKIKFTLATVITKEGEKAHSQSSSASSSSSQSSPTRSWKSDNSEVNKNQVTWRDVSLQKLSPEHIIHAVSKKHITNQNELRKLQLSLNMYVQRMEYPIKMLVLVTVEVKQMKSQITELKQILKTANQNTDNKCSEKTVNVASEDIFTVQFDTNLRESSPGLNCTCIDPTLMLDFPHMLTGSYLSLTTSRDPQC